MINMYEKELSKFSCYKKLKDIKTRPSSIVLFREYQSRLMSWKYRLKHEDSVFIPGKLFNNLFIDLNLSEVEGFVSEEMVIEDLTKMGVKDLYLTLRTYEGFFMSMAINWQLFKSKPEIKSHADLLSPYAPIYRLLSRGGGVFVAEGRFLIDNFETYFATKNLISLPSLDDEFLNYIDNNCSDFPNQLKINGLWEDFNASRIQ